MANIANMLHLSDLHFVKELTERGRTMWLRKTGLKTHSFGRIDALSAKLQEFSLSGKNADVLLATGDISTDGSEESLRTALDFFESGDIHMGTPRRLVTTGLGVGANRRVILPGNHDRYAGNWSIGQEPSDRLESVFGSPATYPYVVGYRRPELRSDPKVPALLFFVFDSTATDLARSEWHNPLYRIARGRLESAECRWLVRQANEIATTKEVQGLDGQPLPVDYRASIRIAVLHHHPVIDEKVNESKELTLLENRQSFIDACFEAGIDIVLFGHEHTAYRTVVKPQPRSDWVPRNYTHNIYFFCCPSTSEYSAKGAGFYFFNFEETQFSVELYRWKGKSFVLDVTTPYKYPRDISPGQAAPRG
jgi:3',5'-cyclic AMP phosphodiesterase CpdA